MLSQVNDNRLIRVWEEEYLLRFWLECASAPLASSPSLYNAIIPARLYYLSEDDRVPRTQNCLKGSHGFQAQSKPQL